MAKRRVSKTPSTDYALESIGDSEPECVPASPSTMLLRSVAEDIFDAAFNAFEPPTARALREHAKALEAMALSLETPEGALN
jgi:hypothetical protein